MPKMTALQGAQSADYKPLLETAGSDSSEEREVATLTDSAEPEPEPEPAVRFDMAGEPLTLHIVRKISTFMQGKDKQQNKTDGEDFAEAMAAIPGLQKRGTSNVLAKISDYDPMAHADGEEPLEDDIATFATFQDVLQECMREYMVMRTNDTDGQHEARFRLSDAGGGARNRDSRFNRHDHNRLSKRVGDRCR